MTAEVIRALRAFTPLSIAELRRRASGGEPLLEFEIFRGPWEETKRSLRQVLDGVEAGRLSLTIHDFTKLEGGPAIENEIPPGRLRQMFVHWREIEHQTAMDIQLEEGYIQSPDEYKREPDESS